MSDPFRYEGRMQPVKTPRTVTVSAGPYATVRAIERARRLYGPKATVRGITGTTTGRAYTYEVVEDQ